MFSLRNVSLVFFSILLVQIITGNVIPQEERASNDTSSDPSPNVSLNGPMQINGAHYFFTSPRRSGISIKGEQGDVTNEEAVDSVETDNSEEVDEDPQLFMAPPSDQSIESGEADEFKDIGDTERGGSDDDLGNYDDYGFSPDFFEHIEESDEGDLSEEVTEESVEPLGVFDNDTEEIEGTDQTDAAEDDDFADELDEDVTDETDVNEDGDFIDFTEDEDIMHDEEVLDETDATEEDDGTDETDQGDFTEEDDSDEAGETQSKRTVSTSTQTDDNIERNVEDDHSISRREIQNGDNVTETTSTGTGSEDITVGFTLPEKTEGTPETSANETVPAL